MLSTVETKVWAGAVGAGGGAVVASAIEWGLGVWAWGADKGADHAQDAINAVPGPIAALVLLGVTVVGSLIGGYNAPPSNHAGNQATGLAMDDADAGHDAPRVPPPPEGGMTISDDQDDVTVAGAS